MTTLSDTITQSGARLAVTHWALDLPRGVATPRCSSAGPFFSDEPGRANVVTCLFLPPSRPTKSHHEISDMHFS